MSLEYVIESVQVLKNQHGNLSPMAMAHELGIIVDARRYGDAELTFRGFAVRIFNQLHITLNLDQSDMYQEVCLAHELGHCVLHPYSADARAFTSISVDNTATTEYEASMFAAEYLIDDEDLLQLCMSGRSINEISRELNYPPELVTLKVKALQFKGHTELRLPYIAHGDFLGS